MCAKHPRFRFQSSKNQSRMEQLCNYTRVIITFNQSRIAWLCHTTGV